ncbi:ester cyclase [Vreelandella olivaria]|uniref:Ester cyclase n=1 Tax=Vreelandella olivaria TaxID=390919 RepID=A0ABN5WZ63_9GAMM|nr:ester cyclase [Halomonas olivaria]
MNKRDLEAAYRDYITCLNNQDWTNLGQFVHDDVQHNGQRLGIDGYRAMLEADYEQIPDLHFNIELLAIDSPHVACRLRFDVTPKGNFLGLPINGQNVTFCENVFYRFHDNKIQEVWSVIDKTEIEAQLD